jgi:hypothetical protein
MITNDMNTDGYNTVEKCTVAHRIILPGLSLCALVQDFRQDQDFPESNLLQRGSIYSWSTKNSAKKCSPENPALKSRAEYSE